ncbi:MAG: hypothetical protein ACR2QG_06920 [Gammaproteobacteria bacterium]
MSMNDPLRIFITHSYQEHEEFTRVFEYLESRDNFFYENCSDPENKPAGGALEAVQEHLRNQIEKAEVVIFPVGMHAQDPNLYNFQLTVAQAFKKPILAIKSFGDTMIIPPEALKATNDIVEWNDRIITDTVRRLARGDASESDIIEFDIEGLDIPEIPK